MNCAHWEERIALYAGGDLPAAEAAEVERHLGDCPGCQLFASGLKESLQLLQGIHQEEIAPAHFAAVRARVMARLEGSLQPWWRKLVVVWPGRGRSGGSVPDAGVASGGAATSEADRGTGSAAAAAGGSCTGRAVGTAGDQGASRPATEGSAAGNGTARA